MSWMQYDSMSREGNRPISLGPLPDELDNDDPTVIELEADPSIRARLA